MKVYLNGTMMPRENAAISPFDRGFLFADGVYEGLRSVPSTDGSAGTARIVGLKLHVARLGEGLRRSGILSAADTFPRQLGRLSAELLVANGLIDGFVYWQVTRGTPGSEVSGMAVRARVPPQGRHAQPALRPTVFGFCAPQPPLDHFDPSRGGLVPVKSAVTVRDIRWELGRLKSISLMGNVLCALEADTGGADEAVLVRGLGEGPRSGVVCEGLATNVVLVTADGDVVTPSLESAPMLEGVTRALVLRAAARAGTPIVERTVYADELPAAREVMVVGTTTMVTAITRLDGRVVGDGQAGPVARRLLSLLIEMIRCGEDDA